MNEYEIVCHGVYSIFDSPSIRYGDECFKQIPLEEWLELQCRYRYAYDICNDYYIFTKLKQKKEQTMNYSTALFLINKNLRGVLCTYENYEKPKATDKVMYKTLDPDIKVGDYVIVPTTTRHNMTVVRVTDVDVEPDFDSDKEVKFIVGKVDKTEYDVIRIQEDQAIETMKAAEATSKREELKKKLMAHAAMSDKIKNLPIYANGGATE